jgi:hypothetical protein
MSGVNPVTATVEQTKLGSLVEAGMNIAIGYVVTQALPAKLF